MDASGVQVNVIRPFSTSTTRIRLSSPIGGGGKCPSVTALQYERPDIDAAVACVVIGSRQVINRDCSAPQPAVFAVSVPPPCASREVIVHRLSETDRFTYI